MGEHIIFKAEVYDIDYGTTTGSRILTTNQGHIMILKSNLDQYNIFRFLNRVWILWAPSHVRIDGNEVADQLGMSELESSVYESLLEN